MPFITKYRKRSRYRTFPITVVFISEQEIKLNMNSVLSSTLTEHVKNQYVCLKLSLIFHHNSRLFSKIPVKSPFLLVNSKRLHVSVCQQKCIKQTGELTFTTLGFFEADDILMIIFPFFFFFFFFSFFFHGLKFHANCLHCLHWRQFA